MGPGGWTQVIKLGHKHLDLLSHLVCLVGLLSSQMRYWSDCIQVWIIFFFMDIHLLGTQRLFQTCHVFRSRYFCSSEVILYLCSVLSAWMLWNSYSPRQPGSLLSPIYLLFSSIALTRCQFILSFRGVSGLPSECSVRLVGSLVHSLSPTVWIWMLLSAAFPAGTEPLLLLLFPFSFETSLYIFPV